jgi:hypothetical protein
MQPQPLDLSAQRSFPRVHFNFACKVFASDKAYYNILYRVYLSFIGHALDDSE